MIHVYIGPIEKLIYEILACIITIIRFQVHFISIIAITS